MEDGRGVGVETGPVEGVSSLLICLFTGSGIGFMEGLEEGEMGTMVGGIMDEGDVLGGDVLEGQGREAV